ncbi:MAG TPA: hypothetical protein VGO18_22305, partial [Steroidobacteraceae bacterium]|nr:hypothetical protein [Steroidobacteraceae bacterium]
MKWFGAGWSLSLFGRTFLLMVAALVIAEAIGLTLLITRPPIHNAPVPLSELGRQLVAAEASPGDGGPPGFREADSIRPPSPGGPGDRAGHGDGAGSGGPSGPGGSGGSELNIRYSLPPPEPTSGSPLRPASDLQRLLAARLHVAPDRVRVFVQQDDPAARPPP